MGRAGRRGPQGPRDVLVSHEILAAADARAGRAGAGLLPRRRGARRPHRPRPRPADPRGVAGAGQAPGPPRLRRFLDAAGEQPRPHRRPIWFWRVQDLPADPGPLGSRRCPPERVHVVTVPPAAARATALGAVRRRRRPRPAARRTPRAGPPTPPSAVPRSPCCAGSTPSSPSAGAAARPTSSWVREQIVKDVLAVRAGMRRATVPPARRPGRRDHREWLEWIRGLRHRRRRRPRGPGAGLARRRGGLGRPGRRRPALVADAAIAVAGARARPDQAEAASARRRWRDWRWRFGERPVLRGGGGRLGGTPPRRGHDDLVGLGSRATPRGRSRRGPPPTRCTSSWSGGSTSSPEAPTPAWSTGCCTPPRRAGAWSTSRCPGRAPRRFGTPAVEPELLPAGELVRLAVGVLARLLPDVPRPAPQARPTAGRSRGDAASGCTAARHRRRRTPGADRPGLRGDRLATHARGHGPAGRGDDGRALGAVHPTAAS